MYKIPEFSVQPDWCQITYTYSVSDSEANVVMSFNAAERLFTFLHQTDLNPSGNDSTEYTISVVGNAGSVLSVSSTGTFTLKVHNPCIDESFVQL